MVMVEPGGSRRRFRQRGAEHLGTAVRTDAGVVAGEGEQELRPGHGDRSGAAPAGEESPGDAEAGADVGSGVEAVVTDLDEAGRQDVLDEASQELEGSEGRRLSFLGGKGDRALVDVGDAAVRDADAVGVPAQVAEEWSLVAKGFLE